MKSCLHIPTWLYVVFAAAMIVALIFHWQHILLYAPYLFILACPLMHLFHGHGGHDHSHKHKDE
jgi:hypothetical protein